jgi:hypothetical protein
MELCFFRLVGKMVGDLLGVCSFSFFVGLTDCGITSQQRSKICRALNEGAGFGPLLTRFPHSSPPGSQISAIRIHYRIVSADLCVDGW